MKELKLQIRKLSFLENATQPIKLGIGFDTV